MQTVPLADKYAEQFRLGIVRALKIALIDLPQDEAALSEIYTSRALHLFSYAFQLETTWLECCQLLLQLAPKMEQSLHHDDWLVYLRKGAQQSQKHQNHKITAAICRYLGQLYYRRSQYHEARYWLSFSRTLFQEMQDESNHCVILNHLALIAIQEGHGQEAIKLVEKVFTQLPIDDPERANSHYILGELAREQRQWQKAEEHYRQSLALWSKQGQRRSVARGLRNLGPALFEQEKYQEAVASYLQAIDIFTEIQDPVHLAITQMNLGVIYSRLGQRNEAVKLFIAAEKLFQKTQDHLNRAKILTNLGITYRLLEEWAAAEQAYKSGIILWRQLANVRGLCNAMDGLGLTYLQQGYMIQATEQFREALTLVPQLPLGPNRDHLEQMLSEHLMKTQ